MKIVPVRQTENEEYRSDRRKKREWLEGRLVVSNRRKNKGYRRENGKREVV